jgi:hypothetical protein
VLVTDKKTKEKKSDIVKDILIGFIILIISVGAFFTYNPADAPLDVGTDGMNFATYPLGVASLLTVLGLIYLGNSLIKYFNLKEDYSFFNYLFQSIQDNKSLYFKRLSTVILLILYALILGEINFMLLTSSFLFLGFFLYERRDYFLMLILSLLGGGFSYALFVYFLKLPV